MLFFYSSMMIFYKIAVSVKKGKEAKLITVTTSLIEFVSAIQKTLRLFPAREDNNSFILIFFK